MGSMRTFTTLTISEFQYGYTPPNPKTITQDINLLVMFSFPYANSQGSFLNMRLLLLKPPKVTVRAGTQRCF